MGKNKIFVKYRFLIVLCLILGVYAGICLECPPLISNHNFRYQIGTIRIENPKLVEFASFVGGNYFVCPDSALAFANDSNWLERPDVFPYYLQDEKYLSKLQPTSTNILTSLRYRLWDCMYNPVDVISVDSLREITIAKFRYKVDLFDAYMQATDGEWYSPTDPKGIDSTADVLSAFRYSNRYRIAVRQHYSCWQIMKLKMSQKKKK